MSTFIYLYGLIPTREIEDASFDSFIGIDGVHIVYALPLDSTTAIVCELDETDYSEEALQERMNNDMEWLQEKAMHHHEALLVLHSQYTLIPMKFCTIYKNIENLAGKMEKSQEDIHQLFAKLKGNQEWNLKIYCDDSVLKEHVMSHNATIAAKQEEISQLSPGKQFFQKRKLDLWVQKELEEEKNKICRQLHEEISQLALADKVKRNWNKEVTGRNVDMSWNSVYLLQSDSVETFLQDIQEKKRVYAEHGWTLEASGPWPAYHFVSLSGNGDETHEYQGND